METAPEETRQLDVVHPGASGEGAPKAVFQTASADGSKVFFTDTQRLTPGASAGSGEEPDLYVAELSGGSAPGSPLTYTLSDLTPGSTDGEAAELVNGAEGVGGVIGASEDGSYVYFVANGALAPGAARGHCPSSSADAPPGTTCNLYVRHYDGAAKEWEPTKLIAVLSSEDAPVWGGDSNRGNLTEMSSRVSPNGEYLAFMSDRSLTGYDNEDESSKGPAKALDEEVYLYDASSERLICASCNPTGARPRGVVDLGDRQRRRLEQPKALGLVVDHAEVWGPGKRRGPITGWLRASRDGRRRPAIVRSTSPATCPTRPAVLQQPGPPRAGVD